MFAPPPGEEAAAAAAVRREEFRQYVLRALRPVATVEDALRLIVQGRSVGGWVGQSRATDCQAPSVPPKQPAALHSPRTGCWLAG